MNGKNIARNVIGRDSRELKVDSFGEFCNFFDRLGSHIPIENKNKLLSQYLNRMSYTLVFSHINLIFINRIPILQQMILDVKMLLYIL